VLTLRSLSVDAEDRPVESFVATTVATAAVRGGPAARPGHAHQAVDDRDGGEPQPDEFTAAEFTAVRSRLSNRARCAGRRP